MQHVLFLISCFIQHEEGLPQIKEGDPEQLMLPVQPDGTLVNEELNHMNKEASDLMLQDQPAESMRHEELQKMNPVSAEATGCFKQNQTPENIAIADEAMKRFGYMEEGTSGMMHLYQQAQAESIKMRYEALQKMYHVSDGTSDIVQQDQPTDNIKTEVEAMNNMDEGAASGFTPDTENVKTEDDESAAYHDYSFDEDIKLEPEILLTQHEPLFSNIPNMRLAKALLKQQRLKEGKPEVYQCTQCEYKAGCKRSLKRHIQSVHLGIVYPCQQCDYVAKQAFALNKHVLIVHELKGHPCNQCDFVGEKRGMLLKHVDSVHGGRGIYYYIMFCFYFLSSLSLKKII